MERSERLDPDSLNRPDWNSLKNNYDKHDIGEAYFIGRIHQIGLHVEPWGIDMRHHDESLIYDDKMDLRLWEPLGDHDEPAIWPGDEWTPGEDIMYEQADGVFETQAEPAMADGGMIDFPTRRWMLRGVCDVKTKASRSWLGKFNLRHLAHYTEWADRYNVPVFLYFTMVDTDSESVGEEDFIVPITPFENYETYVRHFDHSTSFKTDWRRIEDDCPFVSDCFRAPDGNPVVSVAEDARTNFDWLVENVL